jgi:hypothetical protein
MARAMNVATDGHDHYWTGYLKSAEAAYEAALASGAAVQEPFGCIGRADFEKRDPTIVGVKLHDDDVALYAAPVPRQAGAMPELVVDALRSAQRFIRNGVEFGYIRMPDADCPDPAHDTPKNIDAALALLSASTPATTVGAKERVCTCFPEDAVTPCARRYAASECAASTQETIVGVKKKMTLDAAGKRVFEVMAHNHDMRDWDEMLSSGKEHYLCIARAALSATATTAGALDELEEQSSDALKDAGDAVTLTGAQLLEALDFIAPDRDSDQLESEATIQYGTGHSGKGLYCWVTEYPEEGAILLDGSTVCAASSSPAADSQDERERAFREATKPRPENSGVGQFCQPGDRRDPRWLVMYDDADRTHSVFEDEQDARDSFAASESMGWNCWLFSPTPRAASSATPSTSAGERES